MKKRIISIISSLVLLLGCFPALAAEEKPYTVEVPVTVSLDNVSGVNLTIALNPHFVTFAEELPTFRAPVLEGKMVAAFQKDDRFNIGIASDTAFSFDGDLVRLRLTLKAQPDKDDELYKLMKVRSDENPIWQTDAVLLSGIQNNGSYNHPVSVLLNEGTAFMNDVPYTSGTSISAEGSYHLKATDQSGLVRDVFFEIDYTPPQITISSYDTTPTKSPLTVYASVNEGTLNTNSYVFAKNGSFTFTAADAAGNKSERTVTVSHLYTNAVLSLSGAPEKPTVRQGERLELNGWVLLVEYYDENGIITRESVPVTEEMLTYSTDIPGEQPVSLLWSGEQLQFKILVKQVLSFYDVSDQWFANAVQYCSENGLMTGKGEAPDGSGKQIFDPDACMTRAEFVTVLYNMEGKPEVKYQEVFTDVSSEQWFASAVLWAYKEGIVNGKTNTSFDPDANITRQDIATIFYRYAVEYKEIALNVTNVENLLGIFSDAGQVGDYAKIPMAAMNQAGVITGDGDRLKPQDNATRAEAATMLSRFVPYISTLNDSHT